MFKNKEIRNKILFTLAMLFIFRFGSGIPVPGIDTNALMQGISDNSLIGIMNLLGGGAMEKFSVFSLGVGPYITASIIIQLLAMDVIPALTEMAKNGQQGRMQMDKITRYLAIVLAFVQAYTLTYSFDVRPQEHNIHMFGGLINQILPIRVNDRGALVNTICKYKTMSGEKESYKLSGKALMGGALKLNQQWMGTGFNDKVRALGDFGSRLYYIKAIEE
jgi:hypothetical protein